jgi:hypothetical protein
MDLEMDRTIERGRTTPRFPHHGWVGIGLIAVFWALNWGLDGMRTHLLFFPLWLGYCLTVDAISVFRTGTSLFLRSRRLYACLFLISVPVWWSFEVLNWRIMNWHYLGRELLTNFEYLVISSLSFSTVIPAVLGTAELVAGFSYVRKRKLGRALKPSATITRLFFLTGILMFAMMMAWPRLFFPFVWIFTVLILEPFNVWFGNQTLFNWTRRGDWRPVIALFLGVLICGFFWEMWNYLSFPKWNYTVPFFNFWHLFEMPLPGYLGYLPFSLEIVAYTHLILGLFGRKRSDYVMTGIAPHDSG